MHDLIPDYKLDDEYIHKFLGKLSPKEENQLIQVKKHVWILVKPFVIVKAINHLSWMLTLAKSGWSQNNINEYW